MTDEELDRVLDCPMADNDSRASTVRGYLTALLTALWIEEEGFGGKRPFGNSGWKWEVATALAVAGLIEATLETDEGGTYIDAMSQAQEVNFELLMRAAIVRLGVSS